MKHCDYLVMITVTIIVADYIPEGHTLASGNFVFAVIYINNKRYFACPLFM